MSATCVAAAYPSGKLSMFVRASIAMAQRVPGRCLLEADARSAERPKLFSAFAVSLCIIKVLIITLQLLCIVH